MRPVVPPDQGRDDRRVWTVYMIFGTMPLRMAANVRLRLYHCKYRRDGGQFRRILHSYLLEYC
jgi:hypothetical protein